MALTQCPVVVCPCCGSEFHEDAYFELSLGSVIQCPDCEKNLEMVEEEVVRYWAWKEQQ